MLKSLLVALRPTHWLKNLIVAGPLVFSLSILNVDRVLLTVIAIGLLCALASAVYLLNDIVDVESDRRHPTKSQRPLAAGTLSIPVAASTAALLAAASLTISFAVNFSFGEFAVLYLLNNLAYTFIIKHVVILDVMSLAAGFVIRVLAGAAIIAVPASEWLIMCTILLAMFLGFAKRRHEIVLLAENADSHRKVLDHYSAYFLDQLILISGAATVVCYALYTVAPHTIDQFGTDKLIYTVPFVLYGLFRYLYLVHQRESGGNPTQVFLADRPTLINVLLWLLCASLIIYRGSLTRLIAAH